VDMPAVFSVIGSYLTAPISVLLKYVLCIQISEYQ